MDEPFNREKLAGYNPELLQRANVPVIGAGALANNLVQCLALSGVGELRIVDFDVIELTNLTRSPLFPRDSVRGTKPRHKARVLAAEALKLSYAPEPTIRSTIGYFQDIGFGFFEGAGAIACAVDSFGARAEGSDMARLLGVPYIEAGFRGSAGQLTLFGNRNPDEPCFRCLQPEAVRGGVSCALYARQVASEGRTPATQTVAAVFGALAAEAVIAAVHGDLRLSGHMLSLDLRTGRSSLARVTADPMCPGAHRIWRDRIEDVEVGADDSVATLLTKAGAAFAEPALLLRHPYVVSAPCERCGRPVSIQNLARRLKEPPACKSCVTGVIPAGSGPEVLTAISVGSPYAKRPLSRFGIRSRDVVEIEDRATGESRIVRLSGSIEDLFVTWMRDTSKAGSAVAPSSDEASEASVETAAVRDESASKATTLFAHKA